MITVLLADDHSLVRKGFRRMLEDDPDIHVVGEASNGLEAVELASQLRPNVIVRDYAMPGLDGVQATLEIRLKIHEPPILILSMHSDSTSIPNASDPGPNCNIVTNAMRLHPPSQ